MSFCIKSYMLHELYIMHVYVWGSYHWAGWGAPRKHAVCVVL